MRVTDDCVQCGCCVSGIDNRPMCPKEAISLGPNGAVIDKDKCVNCGKCVGSCGVGAIVEDE